MYAIKSKYVSRFTCCFEMGRFGYQLLRVATMLSISLLVT